ncbi:MAG TPA: alpha/beta fold hydrolase [Solirubrobacteraceae bacterium]
MARIVLVHGAFMGAWCWEPVTRALAEAGHSVQTVDLPGNGHDDTPASEASLERYAERICGVLQSGSPALLVGHSMGGVAITQAAARCPEQVTGLVYVCAFAPQDGQSLGDLVSYPEGAGDQVQAHMVVEGDVAVLRGEGAKRALMACTTPEQADWAEAGLTPQPLRPFVEKVELSGPNEAEFTALHRAYIVCTQDQAIPPALQYRMSAQGFDLTTELDADHLPWLSRAEEFLGVMTDIAGRPEFSGAAAG